ncbi:unnamed protein product, partial [Prunus brigantina]
MYNVYFAKTKSSSLCFIFPPVKFFFFFSLWNHQNQNPQSQGLAKSSLGEARIVIFIVLGVILRIICVPFKITRILSFSR